MTHSLRWKAHIQNHVKINLQTKLESEEDPFSYAKIFEDMSVWVIRLWYNNCVKIRGVPRLNESSATSDFDYREQIECKHWLFIIENRLICYDFLEKTHRGEVFIYINWSQQNETIMYCQRENLQRLITFFTSRNWKEETRGEANFRRC